MIEWEMRAIGMNFIGIAGGRIKFADGSGEIHVFKTWGEARVYLDKVRNRIDMCRACSHYCVGCNAYPSDAIRCLAEERR